MFVTSRRRPRATHIADRCTRSRRGFVAGPPSSMTLRIAGCQTRGVSVTPISAWSLLLLARERRVHSLDVGEGVDVARRFVVADAHDAREAQRVPRSVARRALNVVELHLQHDR